MRYIALGDSMSIDLYPALDAGETDVAVALERRTEAGAIAPLGAAFSRAWRVGGAGAAVVLEKIACRTVGARRERGPSHLGPSAQDDVNSVEGALK